MADDSWKHGTGRLAIIRTAGKPGRGKPPLGNRLERDRMVAFVEHHDPHREFRTRTVEAAAKYFQCDVKTVWSALREYRPVRVTSLPNVEWSPPTLIAWVPAPNRRVRLPAGVKWGKPTPFTFRSFTLRTGD